MGAVERLFLGIHLLLSCLLVLPTLNGGVGDPYATIANDGSIVVTNSKSLCANAFLPPNQVKTISSSNNTQFFVKPFSFFNFTAHPNAPLSIVNVGAGTTGTSLIFQVIGWLTSLCALFNSCLLIYPLNNLLSLSLFCLSVCLSVYLSICLSISLSVYLSICLSDILCWIWFVLNSLGIELPCW